MFFQVIFIMDIMIVMLNGTSVSLTVNPGDTVASLKLRIQEKLGVVTYKQRLIVDNGRRIPLNDDSQTLSSYGLQSGARVSVLITQQTKIEVTIRNEKGKSSVYDVEPDEVVRNLKTKVECREGVPVSQQRLLYQSRDMEDAKRLSDYGVTHLSAIDLVLRLRGG